MVHLGAAACAGFVTGTATNPIWLVKTRLQLDKETSGAAGKSRQYKNSFDCIRQVVGEEGIRGLYRGLSASYLGVAESTLQWVLYERMKTHLAARKQAILDDGKELTSWDNFVDTGGKLGAAGAAKLFAACLTYPHEVVRTRMRQRPMNNGRLKYRGLIHCFKTVWKEEGIVSMYGGLSPHLVSHPTIPRREVFTNINTSFVSFLARRLCSVCTRRSSVSSARRRNSTTTRYHSVHRRR